MHYSYNVKRFFVHYCYNGKGKMEKFNQTKYINKFIKENYDTIRFQLPKGQKENVIKHYQKKGYKSMNEYIKLLIQKDMEQS